VRAKGFEVKVLEAAEVGVTKLDVAEAEEEEGRRATREEVRWNPSVVVDLKLNHVELDRRKAARFDPRPFSRSLVPDDRRRVERTK
jgi:hypothetical protein